MGPHSETNISTTDSALATKLTEVLKTHGGIHEEIMEIEIYEPPELRGEHILTDTVYGKIKFQDPTVKPRNIFIKKFSGNPLHTEMVQKMRVMEKESTFFNEFLPFANKFCRNSTGIEKFLDCFPKCLYADNEIIVLENLVLDYSFVMLSKEDKQDLDTAKFALKQLAKFHSVTYAMIKEFGADEFKSKWEPNVSECFDINKNPGIGDMYDNGLGTCLSLVKKYDFYGRDEALDYLTSLQGKLWPEIEKLLQANREADEFVVLNHGDCWNNNMLFKVDPVTKKVVEHIFVDFQITRYGSPCLDLGYFLFTSVKPEVRRAHLKELLGHYYEHFTRNLQVFGTTLDLAFEDFLKEYKKNYRFGFIAYICFFAAIGAFKEMDHDSFGTDPENAMESYANVINTWIKNNPGKTEPIAKELIAVIQEEKKLLGL